MSAAMNTRERVEAAFHFKPVDRLPVVEWASWWNRTLERWRGEGLPADADPVDFFGLDRLIQFWIPMRDDSRLPAPAYHGAPVLATMDDYRRLREHMYQFDVPPLFDADAWRRAFARQDAGDAAVWFTLEGFFWFPRALLGIEPHLYAFYDEPELMHAINHDLADYHLRLIDRIRPLGRPAFMTFAEDMSYNHGAMLSEASFDEFLLPYYRRVLPALKDWGVLALIDSDGDITEPWRWFERAGLEGILPLERQAGVDVAALRRDHPTMRMLGAFDKMTMARGEEAMRAEWERLLPVMRLGGFIPSVDHQTPPGVSLEQYRTYVRLAREYVVRAAE